MKRLVFMCASLLALAGCVEEFDNVSSIVDGEETLNISFEPGTKVQLDEDQSPVWTEGDLLSVFNYKNANERWKFRGNTGDTYGVIAQNEIVDGPAMGEIVIAYPYRTDYILDPAIKTISTTFSPTQTYLKGSYGLADNVLISSGTSSDVVLKNVFGWMKFQFVGPTPIRKIEINDNEFEQLNGPIDINYETMDVEFAEYNVGGDSFGGSMVSDIVIMLDCGESGVALNPSKATSFYICMVPRTFANGFTIKVTGTDGTVMTKTISKEIVIERNVIKPFAELQFGEIVYDDLSEAGTANSYIVSGPGAYKIPTVQGNSSTSVGAVATVEVLWETFGTDVTPNVGDLVSDVTYADGYISFKASDNKGNASIAAKDAAGMILWSWHIWMTDKPEDQVYKNNAGTMMDRNLGATSATPGDVGALGLLYQWGRKDPFLGSSSISSDTKAKSTPNLWSITSSSASTGTIAYATSNPTTFIKYNSSNYDWYYTGDNTTDDTRWQPAKTIYDPCPVGYRVPDGGPAGVWSTAFGTSGYFNEGAYDSTNEGSNFGKSESTNYLTEDSDCWYPAAGYLFGSSGSLNNVGDSGLYWSCSPNGKSAYSLGFLDNGGVYPSYGSSRAYGLSVRCLRE